MYVISIVTEHDVFEGDSYRVVRKYEKGAVDVIDSAGDVFTLQPEKYSSLEEGGSHKESDRKNSVDIP